MTGLNDSECAIEMSAEDGNRESNDPSQHSYVDPEVLVTTAVIPTTDATLTSTPQPDQTEPYVSDAASSKEEPAIEPNSEIIQGNQSELPLVAEVRLESNPATESKAVDPEVIQILDEVIARILLAAIDGTDGTMRDAELDEDRKRPSRSISTHTIDVKDVTVLIAEEETMEVMKDEAASDEAVNVESSDSAAEIVSGGLEEEVAGETEEEVMEVPQVVKTPAKSMLDMFAPKKVPKKKTKKIADSDDDNDNRDNADSDGEHKAIKAIKARKSPIPWIIGTNCLKKKLFLLRPKVRVPHFKSTVERNASARTLISILSPQPPMWSSFSSLRTPLLNDQKPENSGDNSSSSETAIDTKKSKSHSKYPINPRIKKAKLGITRPGSGLIIADFPPWRPGYSKISPWMPKKSNAKKSIKMDSTEEAVQKILEVLPPLSTMTSQYESSEIFLNRILTAYYSRCKMIEEAAIVTEGAKSNPSTVMSTPKKKIRKVDSDEVSSSDGLKSCSMSTIVPLPSVAEETEYCHDGFHTSDPVPKILDHANETLDHANETLDHALEILDPVSEILDPVPEILDPVPEILDHAPETLDHALEILDPVSEILDPVPEILYHAPEILDPVPEILGATETLSIEIPYPSPIKPTHGSPSSRSPKSRLYPPRSLPTKADFDRVATNSIHSATFSASSPFSCDPRTPIKAILESQSSASSPRRLSSKKKRKDELHKVKNINTSTNHFSPTRASKASEYQRRYFCAESS